MAHIAEDAAALLTGMDSHRKLEQFQIDSTAGLDRN